MSLRRPIPTLVVVASVASLTLGACSRSVPVTTNGAPVASPDVGRWSADLKQPTLSSTPVMSGGAGSGGSQASSYGSALLSRIEGVDRVHYEISVTAPPLSGRQVAWAIYTGSCTTPSPPVVPVNELPGIDLGSGGSGMARGEIAMSLDPRTTYNVRVYGSNRATDLLNVVICSRLTYSGKR